MPDIPVPPEAVPVESLIDYGPAIDAAIAKAEWAATRPAWDSPELVGRLIAAEVLRVVTPAIAAAERERIRRLAEQHDVFYVVAVASAGDEEHPGGVCDETRPFADLLGDTDA